MPRVCLVVDNPLRDLDGLVLLGRELAQSGIETMLTPMYEQSFDVAAFEPDLVLVNYVRPNNRDLLIRYKEKGIRVGVLDTEGAGGRSASEFAQLVAHGGAADIVDFYCVWGPAQLEALAPLLGERLRLTGCPRYDYCAQPWRQALHRPDLPPGYVLINTNFPTVNPRYSGGARDERRTVVRVGFSKDMANAYLAAAQRALAGMVELSGKLAERLPEQRFVLRPHPFESMDVYRELERLPNFSVRQQGTSLDWLEGASLLLHLNCSTAVEATMLGVEPDIGRDVNVDELRPLLWRGAGEHGSVGAAE